MTAKEFTITLGEKITDKQLDHLISDLQRNMPQIIEKQLRVVFDFSNVKWIANQELLVITSFLHYLNEAEIDFFVKFLNTSNPEAIDRRKATQIIQVWDVWKIGKIVKDQNYDKHFDITSNFTQRLKEQYGITSVSQEIYSRHGVTPFIQLDQIKKYDDRRISEKLTQLYQLNEATKELLLKNNCSMPFDNKTLSSIITKELYENFLDHFKPGIFNTQKDFSFLSISLITKINEQTHTPDQIQSIRKGNFEEEMLPEFGDFYYDSKTRKYRNQSILQLSFVDFGAGICQTLKEQYILRKKTFKTDIIEGTMDDNILAYAFEYDSSKDPVDKRYLDKATIPRGLFDLISIVRRFNGLLVARSNKGKVLFNFSSNKKDNFCKRFGDKTLSFPGTLISIYLPERSNQNRISLVPIKPFEFDNNINFNKRETVSVSLFEIQAELKKQNYAKDVLYNKTFEIFIDKFKNDEIDRLYYVDFNGYEIDDRVTRKLIFFLATDYRINVNSSVIVLNPPPVEYLTAIQEELAILPETAKQFHIHPTPFVYFCESTHDITLFWIGVFNQNDILKLNDLLFDVSALRSSEFENPEGIVGNVNYYDTYGNLISLIDRTNLIRMLTVQKNRLAEIQAKNLVLKHIKKEPGMVYLCNGNYYQDVYMQLFDLLTDYNSCKILARTLANKLESEIGSLEAHYYIYNTTSSEKLISEFIAENRIQQDHCFFVKDNLNGFIDEIVDRGISKASRFILICDVLSTGHMWNKLLPHLTEIEMHLHKICVIVNGIDNTFEPEIQKYGLFQDQIISLVEFPMKKYRRSTIREKLLKKELHVRRINPYTNTPITQSIAQNAVGDSSLLKNSEFIQIIDESHVKVGYYKFNNLIHPYFFDMDKLLKDESRSKILLKELFSRIPQSLVKDLDILFFPKKSGIENLDLNFLREEILGNHGLKIVELERFSTNEGWRFPHPPEYLYTDSEGKKVMILDDGSCSGESVIQMVDEIASLNVKHITVLSIIGRINDHKKDFFSRIRMFATAKEDIKITVLFGSHWHVPTYFIEESPIIKEKAWLEELLQHSNLPIKIRTTAENILKELELKPITATNNKYLLQPKKGAFILKDLLLTKEEIGRISTYRFYKENFKFFDEFILDYENDKVTADRYKKIELIAAVFLHEPNLYGKVKEVLPDLTEKLEVFITTIFFGNPTKSKRPMLDKANLYYKWSFKNLFHLYFIVFQNDQLYNELPVNKLVSLMNRFCHEETDLYYLLYRLLRYYPNKLTKSFDKIYAGKMTYLLNAAIENPSLHPAIANKCKRFRSFISTLPKDPNSFELAIGKLKSNYSKLTDDKNHNQSVTLQVDLILTQLELLESKFDQSYINNIAKAWPDVSAFIEDLLSFSKTFPEFFAPCEDKVYSRLELNNDSLRNLHGEISEEIYSLSQKSEFPKIAKLIRDVLSRFVLSSTVYHEIFSSISTSDLPELFNTFLLNIDSLYPDISVNELNSLNFEGSIAVPSYYIKEIIFAEIMKNFRHCDPKSKIDFSWEQDELFLTLTICNGMRPGNKNGGGGSGILKLETLQYMPKYTVSYSKNENKSTNEFYQIIKLKTI